jgi:hypothetical protein
MFNLLFGVLTLSVTSSALAEVDPEMEKAPSETAIDSRLAWDAFRCAALEEDDAARDDFVQIGYITGEAFIEAVQAGRLTSNEYGHLYIGWYSGGSTYEAAIARWKQDADNTSAAFVIGRLAERLNRQVTRPEPGEAQKCRQLLLDWRERENARPSE